MQFSHLTSSTHLWLSIRLHVWVFALALLSGCSQSVSPQNEVHVFAAVSLTEGFTELAANFEQIHPGARVRLHFGGSQVLALQLEQGAKADCYASAAPKHIERLINGGILVNRRSIATNRIAVAVPKSSTTFKSAIDALKRANRIVVGHPSAPIGQYTEIFFEKLKSLEEKATVKNLRKRIVSREKNVRLVRAKVAMGVADAAIIYATDAINDASIRSLALQPELAVPVQYEIGVHKNATALGREWVTFLQGAAAKKVLKSHGFEVTY